MGCIGARAMHVHYAYEEAPLLSGNFDVATRSLVHRHSSSSAIRWYMTCGLVVHCARATHVHVGSPLISKFFELATWKLAHR